ncbi:hypothetical protein BHYA_0237g00020 [Botrytis hyacinthi]|uniref:Uncharacterized protein n=1 Tax=Botrytis hyacinthi TaxID=278943 RepID=A0A4Z1G9U7_9HELO|nr:hypothetical protein BHYA_0237g00020 [Botrytis hyacinthi]
MTLSTTEEPSNFLLLHQQHNDITLIARSQESKKLHAFQQEPTITNNIQEASQASQASQSASGRVIVVPFRDRQAEQ